jgi:hypothetical protein
MYLFFLQDFGHLFGQMANPAQARWVHWSALFSLDQLNSPSGQTTGRGFFANA